MRLRPNNPALAEARTVFPTRVTSVIEAKRVLQPASQNKKLSGGYPLVAKGRWRGLPMYTVTLEERATCSSSCEQWAACYGNNMRFTRRVDHRDPTALMARLESEINELLRLYRKVIVRLHVLGDFFSVEYARFWQQQLARHPDLLLFGFTHWARDSPIGQEIAAMNDMDRVWLRFSDQGGSMSANVEGEGIQCPEQTGKSASCMTCGICWSTDQPVRFKAH